MMVMASSCWGLLWVQKRETNYLLCPQEPIINHGGGVVMCVALVWRRMKLVMVPFVKLHLWCSVWAFQKRTVVFVVYPERPRTGQFVRMRTLGWVRFAFVGP